MRDINPLLYADMRAKNVESVSTTLNDCQSNRQPFMKPESAL